MLRVVPLGKKKGACRYVPEVREARDKDLGTG